MIGHCIGAAGALEAIATIKAITTGWLHPTINQFVSYLLACQSLTNNYIDEPCFSF
jgi:3-oxoacyl-(acyl-carrier-protein) synthase